MSARLILQILALACFALGAWGKVITPGSTNIATLGLFLWLLSTMVQ